MTLLLTLFLLLAPPAPSSLDQVKADPNPDHRAKAAVDYASVAEKNAEAAYAKGDTQSVEAELKNVEESLEAAEEALVASHKTPGRNPGPYKYAELHSRELLTRLGDLEQKMDSSERSFIAGVKTKVQELHDAWFEGIMGRKR
jgi:septal ring factor EnvC (AmiA/AmiB activator)